MALNLSIEEAKSSNILDALSNLAKLKQQRAVAQFAQPMEQEKLNRLKTLIEETNLGNQTSRLKMPYVTKREEADIGNKLANTGYLQAETNWMPTKYAIQQGNLDISKGRFSPEQLAANLALAQARTKALNQKTTGGSSINEKGEKYSPFTNPQKTFVQNQTRGLRDVVPDLDELVNIASKGYAGPPSEWFQPSESAKYKSKMSEIKEKLIAAIGTNKTNEALHMIEQYVKRYPLESEEAYRKRAQGIKSNFNSQIIKNMKDLERGGYLLDANAMQSSAGNFTMPSFKDEQEFIQWKKNASPEEISAYKQHLGIK